MTPGRAGLVAGALVAVAAVVLGAAALRGQLLADAGSGLPFLTALRPGAVGPTPSSTPITRVQMLPTAVVPSATPAPPATPVPEAATPTANPAQGYTLRFPWIVVGQTEPPLPLDLRLTPESRPTATPAATPVPQPTPMPEPTRGPLRVTKLGVGLYDSGGAYMPLLDQTRPSVILLMDPTVDFAQAVRKAFPQAFIVGRIFEQSQPLDNPAERGVAFADRVAQTAVPLKGTVDAWMSYNEVSGHGDVTNYRNYNTFQVAFAKRLQGTHGIPAVAGNDGPGSVDPGEYATYFAEAIRTSQYFGIHTYSPQSETSMRSDRSRYLVLRHRQIRDALAAVGLAPRANQFIITEAGLWDGWRGVTSEESMADDFIWYANELNADDYVRGVAVFGLFASDRWANFNIANTSIAQRMGIYNTQGGP